MCAVFVLMTNASAFGQVLVGYDFTGLNTVATANATTVNPNVTPTVLSRGAGAAASAGANSFRTTGFQNNGISTANTDYFQASINANTGFTLSLSSLTAVLTGTATFANAPGVTSQFAYSLDGVNFTLIGSPQTIVGVPQNLTVDLTGVTALQNLPSTTTVTFRYYASGQTTTGGFGFFSGSAGTNGFAINGTTAPVGPTAAFGEIGGRVTANGRGIPKTVLVLSGGDLEEPRFVMTNSFGYYNFSDLNVGQTYILEVKSNRYTFANPTMVVNLMENLSETNFYTVNDSNKSPRQ